MTQKSLQQYDFPTIIAPLKANGIIIPNRFAVIRTDTNQPLGIFSNSYQLIPHKEVIEKSRETLRQDKFIFEEKINVTKKGSHCLIQYTFPEAKIEVQKGDIVSLQIIIVNSYDASTSIRFLAGAFRFVCSNGLVLGKELVHYFQRHTSKLDANVIQERFRDLSGYFVKIVAPAMKKMSESRLPEKTSSQLFEKYEDKKMFPLWLIDDARRRYEEEIPTVWNFYNSFTYHITHRASGLNIETKLKYSKKAWQEAEKLMNDYYKSKNSVI